MCKLGKKIEMGLEKNLSKYFIRRFWVKLNLEVFIVERRKRRKNAS